MYWLFLRKETYFRFNRFYLLSSIAVACILPLVNLGYFAEGNGITAMGGITGIAETIRIPEVTIAEGSALTSGFSISWKHLVIIIYLVGVFAVIARTILGILRVLELKRKGRKIDHVGYSIVHLNRDLAPFSFLKTIYLNETGMEDEDKAYIVHHERIHIQQGHSYDNLFVEFFFVLFWFNPFMWLLKKAMRNTHEYLADHGVLKEESTSTNYQLLLLKQITGFLPMVATNSFNSSIKNRIKMMCRNKSTFLAKFKPLLLVPIILFLTLAFACNEKSEDIAIEPEKEVLPDEIITVTKPPSEEETGQNDSVPEKEVFYIVEEMPTFNGGDPAVEFRKFIGRNLQYPPVAAEKGIEGRVIVQFAVNENGKVENAKVVRSVDPALDQEAIRVIESSPAWDPGKQRGKAVAVLFTFPINFLAQ
jgi:TonB family protein